MEDLKKEYSNLEHKVLSALKERVSKSNKISKHTSGKCIEVNVFGYTELVIIDDELTFLDDVGYHYSIFNGDCNLEDLIYILYSKGK
jgi:hypothetical protein